jgi:hypothetical protein
MLVRNAKNSVEPASLRSNWHGNAAGYFDFFSISDLAQIVA